MRDSETKTVVLIVDAEPMEAEACREILAAEEYEFLVANTARKARELLTAHSEDISTVLLDWNLPETNVVSFLRWLKESPDLSDTEVVLESADFVPEEIEKGISLGAYYYLTKPYEEAQLGAIVKAAVKSYLLKKQILEKVEARRDAFRLMSMGVFQLKTIPEAESLAVRIAKTCGREEAGLGLFELLANSIEHGNLEIGYKEKGRLLAESKLAEDRERRLSLAKYKDRRVKISMQRHTDRLELNITDEGPGFDFHQYQTLDENRLFDAHGRGILPANATLDIEYIPPGNRVCVRFPIEW